MSTCGAEYTDQWGTVVCTKARNHCGDHHAFDADTSFKWTDEIDELAAIRPRFVYCLRCGTTHAPSGRCGRGNR